MEGEEEESWSVGKGLGKSLSTSTGRGSVGEEPPAERCGGGGLEKDLGKSHWLVQLLGSVMRRSHRHGCRRDVHSTWLSYVKLSYTQ